MQLAGKTISRCEKH